MGMLSLHSILGKMIWQQIVFIKYWCLNSDTHEARYRWAGSRKQRKVKKTRCAYSKLRAGGGGRGACLFVMVVVFYIVGGSTLILQSHFRYKIQIYSAKCNLHMDFAFLKQVRKNALFISGVKFPDSFAACNLNKSLIQKTAGIKDLHMSI